MNEHYELVLPEHNGIQPRFGGLKCQHAKIETALRDLRADLASRKSTDVHVHQRLDLPTLDMQMDRTRLQQFGLSAFNVGQNVLVSLSGSSQTAPAFWLNPQNGVVYNIAVQTPQYRIDSLDAIYTTRSKVVAGGGGGAAQIPPGLKADTRCAPAADASPATASSIPFVRFPTLWLH